MHIFKTTSRPTTTVYRQLKQIKTNPAIENLEFKQGKIGDCSLLSAVYAMANNNIGKKCLTYVAQNAQKGEINFGKFKKIEVDSLQFENRQVTAADATQEKLLRQLEMAYDHLEAQKQNTPLGPDMFFSKGRESFEDLNKGLDFSDVCKKFMGFLGIGKGIYVDSSKAQIMGMLEKAQNRPNKYILGLGARGLSEPVLQKYKKEVDKTGLFDLMKKEHMGLLEIVSISRINNSNSSTKNILVEIEEITKNRTKDGFHCNHSYAVKSVDKDTVTIVNPHNSSEPLVVPKEVILDNFDVLSGYEITIPEISTNFLKFGERSVNYQAKAFIRKIDSGKSITQNDLDLFFKNHDTLKSFYEGTVSLDNFKKIAKIVQNVPSEKNVRGLVDVADCTFPPNEKEQALICETIFDIVAKNPTKINIALFKSMLYGENFSYFPKITEDFELKISALGLL